MTLATFTLSFGDYVALAGLLVSIFGGCTAFIVKVLYQGLSTLNALADRVSVVELKMDRVITGDISDLKTRTTRLESLAMGSKT